MQNGTQPKSIVIKGLGSYNPPRVLTNDDLAQMVDTSDEWIRTRTGIRERRIADKGVATSDLAVAAAKAALDDAGIGPQEIDLLVVATITPDMSFPSTACLVQKKLGMRTVPSFDIGAACSGFLYSLEVASGLMRNGTYRHALVIGAEKLSSITDWEDRATCVLFGDGAGAAVLGVSDEPNVGILGTLLGADGNETEILFLPAGGSALPASAESVSNHQHYLKMQGREVFKIAVRAMEQSAKDILARQGLQPEQIGVVIPHQANTRIIEALSTRLGIGLERFKINLDRFGNTSAASIPIALDEAYRNGRFGPGDHILLVAFGAGLTWGSGVLKWQS